MLIYVLYGIFILACLALILSVLLQPGKADASSMFTSSFSSTAFGPRGTQTVLAKISIVSAIVFMFFALLISMGVGGYRSVIGPGDAAAPAAATPAPAAEAPAQDGEAQPNTNAGAAAPAAGEAPPAATPAPPASPAPSR